MAIACPLFDNRASVARNCRASITSEGLTGGPVPSVPDRFPTARLSQFTELSSSPRKAKVGVAGFKMRFSSGRGAGIRYMVDADALLLLHTVGRAGA